MCQSLRIDPDKPDKAKEAFVATVRGIDGVELVGDVLTGKCRIYAALRCSSAAVKAKLLEALDEFRHLRGWKTDECTTL